MTTQGISGATNFNPDDYNIGTSDKQSKENISLFTDAADNFADHVYDDNTVDSDEMNVLYKCLEKIDQLLGNPSQAVKENINKLKTLFAKIADKAGNDHYNGDNIEFNDGKVNVKTTKASMEPTQTETQKAKQDLAFSYREKARAYAQEAGAGGKADAYGNFLPLESSDVNSMFYTLMGKNIEPEEKVKIFSAWLDINKNSMSNSTKDWALGRLNAFITSASNHKFLDEQIDKIKNGKRQSFFDNKKNAEKYLSAMRNVIYGQGLTLSNALDIVNPSS